MNFKSKELRFLHSRGYLKDFTSGSSLDDIFSSGQKICFYMGFDCTASSFHIGHLIQLMVAKFLVKCGHTGLIILGTETAKVGDPTDKKEARKLLSATEVEKNFDSINLYIDGFMKGLDPKLFKVMKNDWLRDLNLVDFLLRFGRHFSVNKMVAMETFKNRLQNQSHLSFLEFCYGLLQAFDFIHLSHEYNCTLQIGGSDQWGNIVAGIELGQKLGLKQDLFGLTTNLLLNAEGQKMGKSVGGAVWLDHNLFSNADFWQYFRNVNDRDVLHLMRLLTEIEDEKIDAYSSPESNIDMNTLKKELASRVVEVCRGLDAATTTSLMMQAKFDGDQKNQPVVPDLTLNLGLLENGGLKLLDILTQLMPKTSKSEIKRLIEQKAVKVYEQIVDSQDYILNKEDIFVHEIDSIKITRISVGKKKKFDVVFS